MSHRIARTLFVVVALFTAAPLLAAENPYPADWFWGKGEQRAKHDAMIGQPAPALDLDGWINGEVTEADRKGKIIVVDFWATWCGPCIASIPHNNAVAKKYADKGVIVLGVCGSRGQEKADAIAKQKGIAYPVGKDHTQQSAKAWNVMWWPTYAIVGRDGEIVCVGLKPHSVDKVIDKLLEAEVAEDNDASTTDAAPTANAALAEIDPAWRESGDRLVEMEGKAPPAMQVERWINSESLKLADLKGKVVVIDFWATWCGPCIRSIPHNNEMAKKYADKGLVFIGVCHARGAEKMQKVVDDHGIAYPVVADIGGKTTKAWGVNGYPDYYIIGRDGKVAIADCRNAMVEKAIEALLENE